MPGNLYRRASDLPETIPVFPLSGAVLFPRWQLPLNIFEPRYLNMIDDMMAGPRLLGMIQPDGGSRAEPDLRSVGCIGRLTSFSETDDGRYLITLTGVCRFRIDAELPVSTPYRQVRIDTSAYETDLKQAIFAGLQSRTELDKAFRAYAKANNISADWDAVGDAPMETLINALATGCPFDPIERQALLEAPDLEARCETLITLLNVNRDSDGGPMQ
ncbi:MAG: LON peptidase substrate-binding domain-containing protein [Pseudomonadota bacterium]